VTSKREQLLDAALEIFDERGYHAGGIDAILERAGVAKMTLYNHFRSKEDLVLAALRRKDEQTRRWLLTEVERRAPSPAGRLVALFEVLGSWFDRPGFRGCPFIRATGEFTDADDPVRAACREHHRLLARALREYADEAGAADPAGLVESLMVLFLGAIAAAQCRGESAPAARAKEIAAMLVARSCGLSGAGGGAGASASG
jgi:AcrR family transcriptional regulator